MVEQQQQQQEARFPEVHLRVVRGSAGANPICLIQTVTQLLLKRSYLGMMEFVNNSATVSVNTEYEDVCALCRSFISLEFVDAV